jgi:peptide/nickel transport system substrate-binding protein
MKKVFMVLLVLLVGTSSLIGCSKAATTTTPAVTTSQTTAPKTTAPPTTAPPTTAPQTTAPPTTSAVNKYGGTLKIILIAGPQTPGGVPAEIFGPDATSSQFCMEPLLRGDNKGGVVPWLAESYKLADDMKSITFTLRQDVKFHDGTDFNAAAAKWNIDNYIASPFNQYWASTEVIDDYTIKVDFRLWVNTILNSFTGNGAWMVSPTAFEKNGIDWARNNPMGTGPFIFESFQRDVSYKVVRNPDYWQAGKPYLDGIEIDYIADPMTQQASMQAGEANMLQLEPGKMAKDLENLGLKTYFQLVTVYSLLPDSAHPDSPYANQAVREAVEYSLDREAMAKAFSYGYWDATYQLLSPSSAAYDPNFTLARKYNVDKAKQLLNDAGYPNGFTTTILVNPAIVNHDIAVALQSNLAAVGIIAELSFPANMGKFIADSNSLDNVLVIQPIMGSANDNATFMFFLGKNAMWNNNFLPSPEFLALKDASLASPTADPTLIRAAFEQLNKEAAAIPFMLAGLGWVMQPGINDAGFGEMASSDVIRGGDVWLSNK